MSRYWLEITDAYGDSLYVKRMDEVELDRMMEQLDEAEGNKLRELAKGKLERYEERR